MAELEVAHVLGELRPDIDKRVLVAPHVRAVAVAAAERVARALPAEEMSVGRAEARRGAERGKVEERSLLHDVRHALRVDDGTHELDRRRFERGETREKVFGRRDRRRVFSAVAVPDVVDFLVEPVLGPFPLRPVGETPRKRKRNRLRLARLERNGYREHSEVALLAPHDIADIALLDETPPELVEAVAPSGMAHLRADSDFTAGVRRHGHGKLAGRAVARIFVARLLRVAAEDDSAKRAGADFLLRKRSAAWIRHRRGHRRLERPFSDIAESPAEKHDRHPARVGIALHKRVHRLKRRLDRHGGVRKSDLRERIRRAEDASAEARIAVVRRGAAERALVKRLVERSLEKTRGDCAAVVGRAQYERRMNRLAARRESLLGDVPYLERLESASSRKGYRAGADAADRHHHAPRLFSSVFAEMRPARRTVRRRRAEHRRAQGRRHHRTD